MPKFIMPPQVRQDISDVVSTSVATYLIEFTKPLFPDFRDTQALDCIADGIADALRRYEREAGKPICHAIALALIDKETPK
jgi:hypothetical protein